MAYQMAHIAALCDCDRHNTIVLLAALPNVADTYTVLFAMLAIGC